MIMNAPLKEQFTEFLTDLWVNDYSALGRMKPQERDNWIEQELARVEGNFALMFLFNEVYKLRQKVQNG